MRLIKRESGGKSNKNFLLNYLLRRGFNFYLFKKNNKYRVKFPVKNNF